MQLSTQVRGQGKTGLDFEEAYNVSNKNASRALNLILMQDAKANEVDSGTELEEDEIEEIGGVEEKEEGDKKDDWEERDWGDQKTHSLVNEQWSRRH